MSDSEAGSVVAPPIPGRPAALRAAGDVLALTGVVLVGELRHGVPVLSAPLQVLDSLVPFLLGWALLAALLGLYAGDPGGGADLRRVTAAWLGAANVGLLLRGSPLFGGGTTWPFPLVITGTVLVAVLAWRVLAARLAPVAVAGTAHRE